MKAMIKYQKTIRLADGHPAILRLEEFPHGEFRTILFEDISAPICKSRFDNEADAVSFFEYLQSRHHVPELSIDCERLAKSLKTAITYAQKYTDHQTSKVDDPGDQAVLYLILNGYDKTQVMAAVKAADSYCFKARHTDLDVYFFLPFSMGLNLAHTKAVEIMCMYFGACGYKARVSYTLDK